MRFPTPMTYHDQSSGCWLALRKERHHLTKRIQVRHFGIVGIGILFALSLFSMHTGWPFSHTIYLEDRETGQSVPSAQVVLHGESLKEQSTGVWQTRFWSRGVLFVKAPGYHPVQAVLGNSNSFWQPEVTLPLSPVRLSGYVMDAENGSALSNCTLFRGELHLPCRADGTFTLSRLLPRERIEFAAPGYRSGVRVFPATTADQIWTVALSPRQVTVQLLDEMGQPLSGADMETAAGVAHKSDENGRIFLSRLSLPLQIVLHKPGYYRRQMTLPTNVSRTYTATLSAVTAVISGTLVNRGKPASLAGQLRTAEATIPLARGQARWRRLSLGAPLTLTITPPAPLACITMTLEAALSAPPADLAPLLHQAVQTAWAATPLFVMATGFRIQKMTTGQLAGGRTFCLAANRLLGSVYDTHGKPLAGVRVAVGERHASSTADGRFLLLGVPAQGKVTLTKAGYHARQFAYREGKPVIVKLHPHGLGGKLTSSAGKPLAQALLVAGTITTTTADDGSFFLPGVNSGVTVTLHAPGYLAAAWTWSEKGIRRRSYGELQGGAAQLQTENCPYDACLQIKAAPWTAYGVYLPMGLLYDQKQVLALLDLVTHSPHLNTIVVDIKGDHGYLAWNSPHAAALGVHNKMGQHIGLKWLVAEAHRRGIYLIGRFVTFKDNPLAEAKPAWAVQRKDGTIWRDREKLAWGDVSLPQVRSYMLDLLTEAARLGLDEIQLDYLRFPSDGDLTVINWPKDFSATTRTTALRTFVKATRERLSPYPVALSADLFGLTIWVSPQQDMGIGQRVIDVAPYVDYVSPMIYPSTFAKHSIGLDYPSLYPYELVHKSVLQGQKRMPANALLRPWLQAYWYPNEEYQVQRLAAEDAHADGWLFWNAAGHYDPSIAAKLPKREMLLEDYHKWQIEERQALHLPPAP